MVGLGSEVRPVRGGLLWASRLLDAVSARRGAAEGFEGGEGGVARLEGVVERARMLDGRIDDCARSMRSRSNRWIRGRDAISAPLARTLCERN